MKLVSFAPKTAFGLVGTTLWCAIRLSAHAAPPSGPQLGQNDKAAPDTPLGTLSAPIVLQQNNLLDSLYIEQNPLGNASKVLPYPPILQPRNVLQPANASLEVLRGQITSTQATLQTDLKALQTLDQKFRHLPPLSQNERAMLQKQIVALQQKVAGDQQRLAAQRAELALLQRKVFLPMASLFVTPPPPTPATPQSRTLLFTPQDAAELIRRHPLLTPEDIARVKVIRLDGVKSNAPDTPQDSAPLHYIPSKP